ncbi:hypothetical protein F4779DRAFT_611994 [Xylariaceae sp. FL0662B]|nr:hypothetical protein F4779DRAFT_611994 [Xylariaceae sp. FL0662B]
MAAQTSATSISFPRYDSSLDPVARDPYLLDSHRISLQHFPPTSFQNQDKREEEWSKEGKILDGFYASLNSSDGRFVTGRQASDAIESLIQECRSLNLSLDFDRIARWAAWKSRTHGIQIVKYLVEKKGANLFNTDIKGRSAIFYCRMSHDVLNYIKSQMPHSSGTEYVNLQDTYGRTPLHYAVMHNDRDTVEHLLTLNADTNITDSEGKRAIDHITHILYDDPSLGLLFAFKKLQNAQPESLYFTHNLIDPEVEQSRLDGFQSNFRSRAAREPRYETREIQDTYLDRRKQMWILLTRTNGIVAHAAMRWLERHTGEDDMLTWRFAKDWLRSKLITPGNPDLLHLEPSCSFEFIPRYKHISATIVFPCLVLRTKEWHKNMRTETRNLRSTMADGMSEKFIHDERTLDETHYPSLSAGVLDSRNEGQVVSREWNRARKESTDKETPIVTVPQLWIWMIGHHIISAFPERNSGRVEAPNIDPFIPSAGIRTGLIIAWYISRFDQKQPNGEFLLLDFFEFGILQVLEDVQSYTDVTTASRPNLEKEHDYMFRIADIREELTMIRVVLNQQLNILNELISEFEDHNPDSLPFLDPRDPIKADNPVLTHDSDQKCLPEEEILDIAHEWEKVKSSRKLINRYQDRVDKLDNDAERIEKRIQDQLNLKRTHTNINDAQASLIAARVGLIVSAAVIGFTVITVVFAPLAFVTALFALPIETLLKSQVQVIGGGGDADDEQGKSAYTTNYVGKWFGKLFFPFLPLKQRTLFCP